MYDEMEKVGACMRYSKQGRSDIMLDYSQAIPEDALETSVERTVESYVTPVETEAMSVHDGSLDGTVTDDKAQRSASYDFQSELSRQVNVPVARQSVQEVDPVDAFDVQF